MTRILFCHRSYPAQFGRLANFLAAHGHQVTFAAEQFSHHVCPWPEGWLLHLQPPDLSDVDTIDPCLREWSLAVQRGQRIQQLLQQLIRADRAPDVVIFQSGLGYGLFLKTELPALACVAYAEWYFQAALLRWLVQRPTTQQLMQLSPRNALIQQELTESDRIVCPTSWQRDQFPAVLRPHIEVIFDGIDTQFFSPAPCYDTLALPTENDDHVVIEHDVPLLTYATRGMEPVRGFVELMQALPTLMELIPELHVVVAGRDRIAYSYPCPSHGGSWLQSFLSASTDSPWLERLHFTGLLPYADYRR